MEQAEEQASLQKFAAPFAGYAATYFQANLHA